MYFRLMGKLSARRKAILEEEKEQGFTLIELLVVVVIIGILAAIAIPIYLGVQDGAKDAAAVSDLTNAKTAVVAYYSQNGASAPKPTVDQLKLLGYVKSDNVGAVNVAGISSSSAFCLSAVSTSSSGPTYVITQDAAAKVGTCTTP